MEVKPSGPVFRDEGTDVVLECVVYGYPRDSSPPVWAWSGRFTTSVTNAHKNMLDESSVSSSESILSKLTITNATKDGSGEYICSVEGNATSVSITIGDSKGIVKVMNTPCMDVQCLLSLLDR